MKIVRPSVSVNYMPFTKEMYEAIERAARVCYKSEDQIGPGTAERIINKLLTNGHEAMIEHMSVSLKFTCDRGVSHELVRHRIASFAQESTRYCNYSKDKSDNQVSFIVPEWFEYGAGYYNEILDGNMSAKISVLCPEEVIWMKQMELAEEAYMKLLELGWSPQQARTVLPNSLKTEIIVTMNLREWRHFFNLRYLGTTGTPHPQMREVAAKAFDIMYRALPIIFEDIRYALIEARLLKNS